MAGTAYSCGTEHGSTREVIGRWVPTRQAQAVRHNFVAVEVRRRVSLSPTAVAEDGSVLDRAALIR